MRAGSVETKGVENGHIQKRGEQLVPRDDDLGESLPVVGEREVDPEEVLPSPDGILDSQTESGCVSEMLGAPLFAVVPRGSRVME